MTTPPRAETLSVLQLEDRSTPAVVLPDPSTFAPGQVLFSLADGVDRNQTLNALAASPVGATAKDLGFGVFRLTLKPGVTVQQAMDYLNGNGHLGFVEPDYKITPDRVPNDPRFTNGDLWGLNNTGQNGGTPNIDIDAPEGWDIAHGTGKTIVAVLDNGVDYTHPDLAANVWVNKGEIPGNGKDDDGNGFVDDVHGYDFVDDDGDPIPVDPVGDDHGTHVAGTVGAVGDNGIGVTGVAWKTQIMALTIYSTNGPAGTNGLISTAVEGFNYAVANGAKVLNNSWKYYGPRSVAFSTAVDNARKNGVIVVVSAGNDGKNNETYDRWPSNFTLYYDNVVAVAAIDRNAALANFSNYSASMVQLGAPGVEIWSTKPGNSYQSLDGTSMATPHVAGALAVVWDQYPGLSYKDLITLLEQSVVPDPALAGKTTTGGRLDLYNMLDSARFGGYAVGADAGGGPNVKVYSQGGTQQASFFAYAPSFTGGVRISYADVNGDRVPDIITVPGGGGGPNVRVFDGKTLQQIYSFFAYDPKFTSGLYVATGDLDGDGQPEIVTSAGETGGPNVRVFKLLGGDRAQLLSSFYAYAAGFTGGVRVAVGDFNGDGVNDVVTAPGFGGGPQIRVFEGASVLAGAPVAIKDFMAGDPNSRFGAYVAVGNFNNDAFADFAVGSGAGSREVRVYDGRSLTFIGGFNVFAPGASAVQVSSTAPTVGGLISNVVSPDQLPPTKGGTQQTPAPTQPTGGLRVAVSDLNGDGIDDIIAVGGPGDTAVVRLRSGSTMTTIGNDTPAFGNVFTGGAFVAAVR